MEKTHLSLLINMENQEKDYRIPLKRGNLVKKLEQNQK